MSEVWIAGEDGNGQWQPWWSDTFPAIHLWDVEPSSDRPWDWTKDDLDDLARLSLDAWFAMRKMLGWPVLDSRSLKPGTKQRYYWKVRRAISAFLASGDDTAKGLDYLVNHSSVDSAWHSLRYRGLKDLWAVTRLICIGVVVLNKEYRDEGKLSMAQMREIDEIYGRYSEHWTRMTEARFTEWGVELEPADA